MLIFLSTAALLVAMVTGVPPGQGHSDDNDDQWAYQWYEGEPFYLVCNSSKLDVQSGHYVVWETPLKQVLERPSPDQKYTDTNYEVNDLNGIRDMELKIKSVTEELHGVYICRVYNSSHALQKRMILGLNIHDVKYHDLKDKYRYNIVVAVIATCVFAVPLGTICFVYHFQYRTPEEKDRKRVKKTGTRKFMYSASGSDMPMQSKEKIVDYGSEPGENGTHDNPNFTQL